MKRSGRHDLLRGSLLLLAGLFILLMAALIYANDSKGKEMSFLISGAIVLLVFLFWIVGGTLAGRRLLEPSQSLTEKLFAVFVAVILVASQIGAFLAPADSPSQIQLYLARNLMLSGLALWFGGLYLNRVLLARGKHSAVPPPCEQE